MHPIRQAREDEVTRIQEIEQAAARLFDGLGVLDEHAAAPHPAEKTRVAVQDNRLWVAADDAGVPIGFALMEEVDGHAHLAELDVLPDHGQQGIGTELLEHVCVWAKEEGYTVLTLTTFHDVPWNAPFYAKHGFAIVPRAELSAAQRVVMEREAGAGLRLDDRVFMQRLL